MVELLLQNSAVSTSNLVKLTPIEYTIPNSDLRQFFIQQQPQLRKLVEESDAQASLGMTRKNNDDEKH